jgi:hypothetical protein
MVFFTCGCCEVEHGQSIMTKIEESELRRIAMSGIGEAYDSMVKILSDPFHLSNQYKIAFATAARNELSDGRDDRRRGLVTGSDYLCKDCLKNLPRDSNPEDDKIVSLTSLFDEEAVEENVLSPSDEFHGLLPPRALVNGYFRGRTPKCLEDLNRTEMSMVNLINVISRITMLPSGGHYASNTTVFSVLNDLVEVATSLPTKPTIDLVAVIRTSNTNLPGEFIYSPYKVHKALLWLSINNFLYKDKVHLEVLVDKDVEEEVPSIIASDEDLNVHTSSSSSSPLSSSSTHSTPRSSSSSSSSSSSCAPSDSSCSSSAEMEDVFLDVEDEKGKPLVVQLRELLVSQLSPVPMERRTHSKEYVHIRTTSNFLPMAFCNIFPYGMGSASSVNDDDDIRIEWNDSYVKHVLQLGKLFFLFFYLSSSFLFCLMFIPGVLSSLYII